MPHSQSILKRDVWAWSLYDFANTIFSMNIVTRYMKPYIVDDLGKPDHYYDIPYALSMLIAAMLLPALGARSDHSANKKWFVALFTIMCCGATALFGAVASDLFFLLLLFVIANFAYEAAMPYYNTLLYSVADGKEARYVSGIGVSLGYVGSVVGMLVILPFVTGDLFGFVIPFIEGSGRTGAFLPTSLLFVLFAVPMFLWVREKPVTRTTPISIPGAYREVWLALRDTKKYPGVRRFLIADYFLEDAVVTVIINMSTFCLIVLSMDEGSITQFLILSTLFAVIGSWLIGKIATRISLKKLLTTIMLGWIISLLVFAFVEIPWVIWVLGPVVGILLGGVWTTTRPYLAELVPRAELGRFFGLFSLSGRSAAVIGPLLWSLVVWTLQPGQPLGKWIGDSLALSNQGAIELPYKGGIIMLACMMSLGLYLLQNVPEKRLSLVDE